MNKIKIVCDSLSDVTDQQIEKYDIEFIPLNIIIGDNEYKDRQDISIDNFYSIIRNDKVIPKTSQATYADFYRVFEKYTQEGYDILYISVSPNATGTYQSAVLASQEFEGHNIKIIDSNSLCYGIGYQVLMACELREDGKSLDEIVDYIESIKNRVYATFFCDGPRIPFKGWKNKRNKGDDRFSSRHKAYMCSQGWPSRKCSSGKRQKEHSPQADRDSQRKWSD